MFSKTNDDKGYHLYKLPPHIILFKNSWLINYSALGGGWFGLGGSWSHSRLLATASCELQAPLLKIEKIAKLRGILSSSLTS